MKKLKSALLSLAMLLALMISALPVAAEENGIDMYRLYNPNSGEHFYTQNGAEKDNLVSKGWRYEGTGWVAPSSGTAVYRLYNPNAGDHHYTTSGGERAHLISVGWKDEGIGWYSDSSQRIPLYRVYNPNAKTGTHHYTTSYGEAQSLVSKGWRDEGIGWYGIGEGKPAPQPAEPEETVYTFVVNKNNKKFHHDNCPSIANMKESNKVFVTGTVSQMVSWGYDPCKVCI